MLFLLFMFIRPWIILLSSHLLPSPRPIRDQKDTFYAFHFVSCVHERVWICDRSGVCGMNGTARIDSVRLPSANTRTHTHHHPGSHWEATIKNERYVLIKCDGVEKEKFCTVSPSWFFVCRMCGVASWIHGVIESTSSAQDVYYIGIKNRRVGI